MDTASESELKVLILEDEPTDAGLVERTLREAGLKFVPERVMTRQGFAEALDWFKRRIVRSAPKSSKTSSSSELAQTTNRKKASQ